MARKLKFKGLGPPGGARKLKFKVLGPRGGPKPSNLRFLAFQKGTESLNLRFCGPLGGKNLQIYVFWPSRGPRKLKYKFIFKLFGVLEGQKS